MRHITIILIAVVAFLLASSLSAQEIEYEVVQIPGLLEHGCLNDNAVVIGTTPDNTAWMWESGAITYLPGLGYEMQAININNSSVIVGWVKDATMNGYHACAWYNGTLSVLSGYPCCIEWYAGDINSSGTIIGNVSDTANGWRTYPYIYSGSMQILYDLEDYSFHGINDGNIIAATAWSGETGRACLYNNGSVTFLSAPGSNTNTNDINNFGHVLGSDESIGFCLWKDGTQIPVGLQYWGEGCGLNDFDVVVGYVEPGGMEYAAVWDNDTTRLLDYLISPDSGFHLVNGWDINNKGEILCTGSDGFAYLLIPDLAITVYDAEGDTIPNVEFNLIKVANNPPAFEEDTLGSFVTDDMGRLALTVITTDTFTVDLNTGTKRLVSGDSLKIALHVHSEPAVKHLDSLGTMYSVHLDNARIDEDGHISFDVLRRNGLDVVLDHTEIRYNLLVSVEWDAERPFLWGLEDNLQAASNYLYDITDGQARLDTIVILDGSVEWEWADVRVHASNAVGSAAYWYGILDGTTPRPIKVPRRDYGDTEDNRDSTYNHHPLDEVAVETFRVLIHELGHYALGFYDEYMFCCLPDGSYDNDFNSELKCAEVDYYGFMHWMREDAGERASEMSSSSQYLDPACLNTMQYLIDLASCWDWWESNTEGDYELAGSVGDTVFVSIIKPDDSARNLEPGLDYIPGPNNNTGFPPGALDYDVGELVVFTREVFPPEPQVTSVHVLVDSVPPGGGEVRLFRNTVDGIVIVKQGNTTDSGYLWVYGANEVLDHIDAGGRRVREVGSPAAIASAPTEDIAWLYGSAAVSGDSLTVSLEPVDGDYPLICEVFLAENDATFKLTAQSVFAAPPSLMLSPSYEQSFDYSFTAVTGGYSAALTDSLGYEGTFIVTASDAVANTFRFWTDYTVAAPDSTDVRIVGPSGLSAVLFDTMDTDIARALLLTSPYPVLRSGLDPDAIQAGETQSLSVYPPAAMDNEGSLFMEYDDAALDLGDGILGDEASLQVYYWDTALVEWILLGGHVDTTRNEVWSPIPGPGVYAAFTTEIVTDVEDDEHGELLPYRFELSQNYPNPFNPTTTIEYNLPRRSHITIEVYNVLGQKVRILVDREESAGSYTITWDGKTTTGKQAATGIYLYRFQAGEHVVTKKMLLLK